MNEEFDSYGINKELAHPRAIELIPEDFFWSCTDIIAPFGSDSGDQALADYRFWKRRFPNLPSYLFLAITIKEIGEIEVSNYDEAILNRNLIKTQIDNLDFNDYYYIYILDVCIIAAGFGQLLDEGIIDEKSKPIIQLAINRQKIWADLSEDWIARDEYMERMKVLDRVLNDL